MFMDRNRAKNGATQPGAQASKQAAEQRAERTLSTQPDLDGSPDNTLFNPSMSTPDAINRAHYDCGVDSDLGQYGLGNYEGSIPHIGKGGPPPVMGQTSDRKLANTP